MLCGECLVCRFVIDGNTNIVRISINEMYTHIPRAYFSFFSCSCGLFSNSFSQSVCHSHSNPTIRPGMTYIRLFDFPSFSKTYFLPQKMVIFFI